MKFKFFSMMAVFFFSTLSVNAQEEIKTVEMDELVKLNCSADYFSIGQPEMGTRVFNVPMAKVSNTNGIEEYQGNQKVTQKSHSLEFKAILKSPYMVFVEVILRRSLKTGQELAVGYSSVYLQLTKDHLRNENTIDARLQFKLDAVDRFNDLKLNSEMFQKNDPLFSGGLSYFRQDSVRGSCDISFKTQYPEFLK